MTTNSKEAHPVGDARRETRTQRTVGSSGMLVFVWAEKVFVVRIKNRCKLARGKDLRTPIPLLVMEAVCHHC